MSTDTIERPAGEPEPLPDVEVPIMEATEPAKLELRVADRCDAHCGAQAFVVVSHATHGSLLWCGHHYAKYEDSLLMQGFLVAIDDRDKINAKPSPSANA